MKSRIFALILALCCLSLLLVACNDKTCAEHVDANNDLICDTCSATIEATTSETEAATAAPETTAPETVPACDAHVDAEPADEYCDICGKNIVVVFLPSEPGETETRVEMEVVTAPADANASDYINLGETKKPVSSMETETDGLDYDRELNDNIVWVEEEVTEAVTVEDGLFEEETEIKVIGSRYDVINLLTGKNIIPTISVPSIDFDPPLVSFTSNSADYTVQNDGFGVGDGYVYATNVGGDEYNDTTTSYTMTFNSSTTVRLYYEVNSESVSYDYLTIYHNGSEEIRVGGEEQSGQISLYVNADDTVTLEYRKDTSVSEDNEYCYVTIDVTGGSSSVSVPHGVTVDAYSYYFVVTKAIYSAEEIAIETETDKEELFETVYSVTIERTAYTYGGIEIAKATWTATYDADLYGYVSEDGTSFSENWKLENYDDLRNPEYAYVTYDGNIYLINKETNELIPGGSALTFIDRPAFDYANDAFGYVVDEYTLYVYDLSQWLECVYTYTIPGYYTDFDFFLLENGSLLLQTVIELPYNAVSFDIQDTYSKYDIVYILIDPAAKTATEVEFGYLIEECLTGSEVFTDKATNVFVVSPINQSMIDDSAMTILVVGNDMTVLCELPELNYEDIEIIGNGYIKMYNDILDCYEILDNSFNFVTYVPGDAYFYESFFVINDLYYTIAGGKIQALDTVLDKALTGEYEFVEYGDMNLILRETVEVPAEEEGELPTTVENYYLVTVDADGFKLTKIGKETNRGYEVLYSATDFGYITMVYMYDQDEFAAEGDIDYEASFFNFYNQLGEKIGSTQDDGINLDNYGYYDCYEDDGVYSLIIRYYDDNGYTSRIYVIQ